MYVAALAAAACAEINLWKQKVVDRVSNLLDQLRCRRRDHTMWWKRGWCCFGHTSLTIIQWNSDASGQRYPPPIGPGEHCKPCNTSGAIGSRL